MRPRLATSLLVPIAVLALPLLWFACTAPSGGSTSSVAVSATPRLAADFQQTVHPFVTTYCVTCHGGNKPKADLDLSAYDTLASVAKDVPRWDQVLERVKAGEMPPDDADKLPTAAERQPVVAWLESMHAAEVARTAGDPGFVLARRLSNAEYDNTIRDLTGVDIQPTKEFPVDPANAAGFDNSGESLAMSPALVKKYLDAARTVADHLVFAPDGLTFASHPMVTEEDRDKYAVHRVVNFYKRQGVDVAKRFETYMGQSVNYATYFAAAWRFQHRAELGRAQTTLADFARDAAVSPKYLARIWDVVSAPREELGPIAAIQARWRALPQPAGGKEPAGLPEGCTGIDDFIYKLRPLVTQAIPNLPGRSIAAGSQTLVLWKDQQYAAQRMTYPGNALKLETAAYQKTDPAMLIPAGAAEKERYEKSFTKFCAVFPDAFVVWERARMFLNPTSREIASDLAGHRLLTAGFHSQMGYFRDDEPLCELVLDDAQRRELDRLWRELNFITEAPFRQLRQFIWFERAEPPSFMFTAEFNSFRNEDADMISEAKIKSLAEVYLAKAEKRQLDPKALQAVKDYFFTINLSVRALEKERQAAEPLHLKSLVAFAERASRRPFSAADKDDLLAFYQSLRKGQQLGHEDAVRECVVSVLMSPTFNFRADVAKVSDQPLPGGVRPLSDYELANRLSYFLWSSMPDQELLAHAAKGDLHRPDVLVAQTRRMLRDERVRGLATEFGGNWLDIRRFEEHNAVDRERFPTFTNELREAMFEEPIRFTTDLVRRNGSILDFVYGEHTFVNATLAKHYGMPAPASADEWVRVDDAKKYQRGGLLPMAAFLTKNAPGLRTSPVKRGHWVVTKLLGERIPAPPPNVPTLPTDETKLGNLTLRQTLAKHREDKTCASCHNKFDSLGLVFEGFGPVGETRTTDLAGRPAETTAVFPDGSEGAGLAGLQKYFHTKVQDEFVENLCRKLMVFALGRSLLPSDDLVIASMRQKLAADNYRFDNLVSEIVTSRQFLNKRVSPDPDSSPAQ